MKAIELATRKVAAVSGDARRALDICRRAAELAQLEGGQKATTTIQHVNAALREMFTSLGLTALRSVSHYERLLLRAIVAEVAARGAEEVPLSRCLQQLHVLCNLEGWYFYFAVFSLHHFSCLTFRNVCLPSRRT